ncbi:MAG: hypothetical protein ABI851_00050 [Saprospiraceae bacterium]
MDNKIERSILITFFLSMSFFAFYFNGTGDDGDSIMHFLYAKYAFVHPENFFNHWAKPIYVFLMAIPAQLGFTAVKIINISLMTMTMFFTFRIGSKMQINPNYVTSLFFIGAPLVISTTLSGLTEPLFAFWLSWCLYFAFNNRLLLSTILISFLPFVRSEGLILMVVFLFFLIFKKAWQKIPFLLTGHLVMGLIGYPIYKDFFWTITKNPYTATQNTSYGHGSWDYYFVNFSHSFGEFITIALIVGISFALLKVLGFLFRKTTFKYEELFLIYGMFAAFIIAHTIFWALGLFNSFGLLRVLVGVIPLIALIGGTAIANWLNYAKTLMLEKFAWLILFIALVFSLRYNQDWNYMLKLNEDQLLFNDLANKYKNTLREHCIYSDAVYPAYILGIDYFDQSKYKSLTKLFNGQYIPAKSAIIWDFRYSVLEAHVQVDRVKNLPMFKEIDVYTRNGNPLVYLFTSDSIVENLNVIRSIDFEKNEIEKKDSNFAKSGKYSLALNIKNEFSPDINIPINEIKGGNSIQLKFDYFFSDSKDLNPLIVYSYEDKNGKIINWNSYAFINEKSKSGTWNTIAYDIKLDREKYQNNKIKVYIWSNSDSSMNVDNLEFSVH